MRYKSLLFCVLAGYLLFSAIWAQTSDQEMTRNLQGVPKVGDNENKSVEASDRIPNPITIFLCGDVAEASIKSYLIPVTQLFMSHI